VTEVVLETMLDPVLVWTLRVFLAAILARAVFAKLRAPHEFADALRGYELVPAHAAGFCAAALLVLECVLVPVLLLPAVAPDAATIVGGLFALYTVAIGINLLRGRRDIDCGCGGPHARQSLHELLLVRNLFYVGIAGLAARADFTTQVRELIWLDGLTIALAALCLITLAVAIDQLAALAARTRSLGALR
jgi:hypothetical protein